MSAFDQSRRSPLILIVDDDQLVRVTINKALEQRGYRTAKAASGNEAITHFASLKPDLVILDLVLPDRDGLTVCRELRKNREVRHIPILIITAHEDFSSIHHAFEAGATDFVVKPVNLDLLVFRIRYMLRASSTIQKLAVSEARLATAQRIALLGNWEWNPSSDIFFGSQEALRILGFVGQNQSLTLDNLLHSIYPLDRNDVEVALRAVASGSPSFSIECRVKQPNATLRVVRLQGESVSGGRGRLPNVIGTLQDITESKQVEDNLRLLKEAVDSLPIGITISNVKGTIIYSNMAEAELHGYTIGELTGKDASILAPEALRKPFGPREISDFGHWKRESINIRKDGKEFPVQLSSIAVRNSEGKHLGVITSCEDISSRKQTEKEIHRLAYQDTLTGLPNRRALMDRLHQALALAQRETRVVGLFFLDLDNFKDVNDTLGHEFGDLLLQEVAARLAANMRESDTLARIGGDEFVLLTTSIVDHEAAAQFSRRILDIIKEPLYIHGRRLFTGASIGIALYPHDGYQVEDLFRCADTAMYHAKNAGKQQFRFFSQEMNAITLRRLALENSLHHGFERKEFSIRYQPQFDLNKGCICGVEAIPFWENGEFGLIGPEVFFPLAEKIGLAARLGEWILRTVFHHANILATVGSSKLRVVINFSWKQIRQPEIIAILDHLVSETAISPENFEFTFAESVIMEQIDSLRITLDTLKQLGFHLSIDNFGAGYSSFKCLRHLPVDRIKIDRSLVPDVVESTDDAEILKSILSLCHHLKLQVIAGGVENRDTLHFLAENGCDMVQGTLLAPPMGINDFCNYLSTSGGINFHRSNLVHLTNVETTSPSSRQALRKEQLPTQTVSPNDVRFQSTFSED